MQIPTNSIGLTGFEQWTDKSKEPRLKELFDQRRTYYTLVTIPRLAPATGSAYLIIFKGCNADKTVTVLCTAYRNDDGMLTEDYFCFEGMELEKALQGHSTSWQSEPFWIDTYHRAIAVLGEALDALKARGKPGP